MRETPLCIKAINKIIVLVILFQTSRLLAHPAAVKDNFLAVTGFRGLLYTLQQSRRSYIELGYRPTGLCD